MKWCLQYKEQLNLTKWNTQFKNCLFNNLPQKHLNNPFTINIGIDSIDKFIATN